MIGSDYELANEIILTAGNTIVKEFSDQSEATWKQLVKKYMIEDAITFPFVSMTITDNWVEFTLRYITDYKKRRTTKNQLYWKILKDIESTGNKVKFA